MKKIYCSKCHRKMRFSRIKSMRAIFYCFKCETERRVKMEDAFGDS